MIHTTDIEKIFLSRYQNYLQTLAEITYDRSKNSSKNKNVSEDKDASLCDNTQKKFFSYDDITQKEIYAGKSTPSSPDLILFNKIQNRIIFVEFKSTKIDIQNVRLKLLEGVIYTLQHTWRRLLQCIKIY